MRSEIQEAIALLKTGDPGATDKALALLQDTVFSFSMRVCGQREDAEDTMQEVLTKSLPVLSRFDNPKAFAVWLYKVARSRCLMSRRKSKFSPSQELSLEQLMPDRAELAHIAQGGGINPEVFAIKSQEARWLREAVQKLPAPYRTVLVLRDMEGLADEEVAEITGLRAGTVRVRLHRARLFVRKELAKRLRAVARPHLPKPQDRVELPRGLQCKAMFAELSEYLDEQLDDSLCQELEKHMDGCGPCRAFVSDLEKTIEVLRTTSKEAPDSRKARSMRAQLMRQYQSALAISARRDR